MNETVDFALAHPGMFTAAELRYYATTGKEFYVPHYKCKELRRLASQKKKQGASKPSHRGINRDGFRPGAERGNASAKRSNAPSVKSY